MWNMEGEPMLDDGRNFDLWAMRMLDKDRRPLFYGMGLATCDFHVVMISRKSCA